MKHTMKLLSASLMMALACGVAQAASTDAQKCLACHDKAMPTKFLTAKMVHGIHQGKMAVPEAKCRACHISNPEDATKNVYNKTSLEGCLSCHDLKTSKTDHSWYTNKDCSTCHDATNVRENHYGKVEKAMAKGQKDIVKLDMKRADIKKEGDEYYAYVAFTMVDPEGKPIAVKDNNPANADWIKNLQLYVNWGADQDFVTSRGYTIYVKSNKKDVTNKGTETTPANERLRTPMHAFENGAHVYRLGPVPMNDQFSGDLKDAMGMISTRLIYCFDPYNELISCDNKKHSKNAAWNQTWFFGQNGLVTDRKRHDVVSNEKCGSCHGYIAEKNETEIQCRSCHSQTTKKNKWLADTTCFSGHDDDAEGNHISAYRDKPKRAPQGMPAFGGSTNDLTHPCLACHNNNTPPLQVLRDGLLKKDDPYFLEELIISHPDHKMWMHSLHANTRRANENPKSIRRVEYTANIANCTRCHEGTTYLPNRLEKRGRPLALATNYNIDSNAHPATDFTIDAYVSPVAATCYGCHGKKLDDKGFANVDPKVRKHMEQFGASFGVKANEVKKEKCSMCHNEAKMKKDHGLQ